LPPIIQRNIAPALPRAGRPWFRSVVAFVLTVGTAGAQDYVAVSTGFPYVFGVHVGFADLLAPGVDLRINLWGTALAASGGVVFGAAAGVDVLAYAVDEEAPRWRPYGGVGAGLAVLGAAGGGSVDAGFAANVSGVAGVAFDRGGTDAFIELRGELLVPAGGPIIYGPAQTGEGRADRRGAGRGAGRGVDDRRTARPSLGNGSSERERRRSGSAWWVKKFR
jgi:hypothetical protein